MSLVMAVAVMATAMVEVDTDTAMVEEVEGMVTVTVVVIAVVSGWLLLVLWHVIVADIVCLFVTFRAWTWARCQQ